MTLSPYLEAGILDYIFGKQTLTQPTTLYIALSTGVATAAVAEPSGNGYARVAVTNNTTNFPSATGSNPATVSNGTLITFPTVTGTAQSWGLCQSFAVYDAASAGNLLCQGALTTNKTPTSGDTLTIPVSDLVVTLT